RAARTRPPRRPRRTSAPPGPRPPARAPRGGPGVRTGGPPPAGLPAPPRPPPVAGAAPAVALGDEQPGTAEVGGQRVPEGSVVRLIAFGPGQHRGPRALVVEQVADRGPEVLFRLLIAQVRQPPRGRCRRRRGGRGGPAGVGGGHRGRSFQGTRVSVRGSAGRPSTRSAMMFRRISEVPPSMEFPRARRYR